MAQLAMATSWFVLAAGIVAASSMEAAAQTPITACGQTFRGTAVLMNDLNCPDISGAGVTVERGELQLNGFTIEAAGVGVSCVGPCSVVGPGSIVLGEVGTGVRGESRTTIDGVQIVGGLYGVLSDKRADVIGSTIHGTTYNVWSLGTAVLRGTTLTDGWWGVRAIRADLHDSEVTGMGGVGVDTHRSAAAAQSTIVGNCIDRGYGNDCVDIASRTRPRVLDVTCDYSAKQQSDLSWGVCALD